MAPKENNNEGWNEYSRLVLSELERLDETSKSIIEKLDKLIVLQEGVTDLKSWKVSAEVDIQALKDFRTTSKTYGTIGQIIIAAIVGIIIDKLSGN